MRETTRPATVHAHVDLQRLVALELHPAGAGEGQSVSLRHGRDAGDDHLEIACPEPVECRSIARAVGGIHASSTRASWPHFPLPL